MAAASKSETSIKRILNRVRPRLPGRKSLVTDSQNMSCIHTVRVFDYPVPSPIWIFLWKTDVCGVISEV